MDDYPIGACPLPAHIPSGAELEALSRQALFVKLPEAFESHLAERLQPGTVLLYVRAVRQLVEESRSLGWGETETPEARQRRRAVYTHAPTTRQTHFRSAWKYWAEFCLQHYNAVIEPDFFAPRSPTNYGPEVVAAAHKLCVTIGLFAAQRLKWGHVHITQGLIMDASGLCNVAALKVGQVVCNKVLLDLFNHFKPQSNEEYVIRADDEDPFLRPSRTLIKRLMNPQGKAQGDNDREVRTIGDLTFYAPPGAPQVRDLTGKIASPEEEARRTLARKKLGLHLGVARPVPWSPDRVRPDGSVPSYEEDVLAGLHGEDVRRQYLAEHPEARTVVEQAAPVVAAPVLAPFSPPPPEVPPQPSEASLEPSAEPLVIGLSDEELFPPSLRAQWEYNTMYGDMPED